MNISLAKNMHQLKLNIQNIVTSFVVIVVRERSLFLQIDFLQQFFTLQCTNRDTCTSIDSIDSFNLRDN